MKPKMSLMVGTKMTSMLLKARMAAAISMWRVQLNSRPLNSSVVMEERIWEGGKRKASCFYSCYNNLLQLHRQPTETSFV